MAVFRSIRNTIPHAMRGVGAMDKVKIFLVIAFETTSFANVARRRRIKDILQRMSTDGLVTIRFNRDGHPMAFELRAGEDGDLSVASEFIRGIYSFPQETPAQIIDGGANIGLFAVQASRRYPEVAIDCYEANPSNMGALRRNLAINGSNARALNTALWSGDGELVFHTHMAYSGHVTEVGAEVEGDSLVRVPAILPEVSENCWMKLDIEGAEYEVVPALIAAGRFPRWISAELHYFLEKGPALVEMLRNNGYKVSGVPEHPTSDMIDVFAERRGG
jgi:FkbM family methyltransferase